MSYEIIRSINEKSRSVVCASNNIRPLIYGKAQYSPTLTVDEFRASVIVDMLFGNFHFSNKNHIYSVVESKVRTTKEYEDLHDKIWNFDDHYTKEYVKEHYEENIKSLKSLVVKTFNETQLAGKEEWVLKYYGSYLRKLNRRTYQTCYEIDNAKVFGSKELAEANSHCLSGDWIAVKKTTTKELIEK